MAYLQWTDEQLEEAGLLAHKKQIVSIGRRLERLCQEMREINLRAFVDASNNIGLHSADCVPHLDPRREGSLILVVNSTPFAGGDW